MNESQQENKLEFIMQPSIDSDQGAEARQFVQELRPQEFSEPVSSNSSVSGDGDSSDTDTDTNSLSAAGMRIGPAFQVLQLPAARNAAHYVPPAGTGGLLVQSDFKSHEAEEQKHLHQRLLMNILRHPSKNFSKIARQAQQDIQKVVAFYYANKHAKKAAARQYKGACAMCSAKLIAQNADQIELTAKPTPANGSSQVAPDLKPNMQGTFMSVGSAHRHEQQDPMLESFTELWGSTGSQIWQAGDSSREAAAKSSTPTSVRKVGPKSLTLVLEDGDEVTYRAHLNLRAVFEAASTSFKCLSECCQSSSPASGLTLSGLERHWGRGKARKAWSNTLKIVADPGAKLKSLQQLLHMQDTTNQSQVEVAVASASSRVPTSRVDLKSSTSPFLDQQPHQAAIFIPRTMCSTMGCSHCICHQCRPPSKTNTIKRHFWACHGCRIQMGLPTATREVSHIANASTRSKRVSYAPPRFEDWIEQHEAEVSIRRRVDPSDNSEESKTAVADSTEIEAPQSPAASTVKATVAEIPESPMDDSPVVSPVKRADDAGQDKIVIPLSKPKKLYLQPKAAPLSKEARKADRKSRRKRRREQDADQVSHKWTTQGIGNFTWLPHLAPKSLESAPTPQRHIPVLQAVLPKSLLINPFFGATGRATEMQAPPSKAARRMDAQHISFKIRGSLRATAAIQTPSDQDAEALPVHWQVHTVQVHEAVKSAGRPGILHTALCDPSSLML